MKLQTFYYLGATIRVFYLNSPEDTLNINNFNILLQDFYDHTYKYDGNLLNGLVIEVYDYRLPDIPLTKNICNSNVCYKELGIGNYGGLTYESSPAYPQGLIKLNTGSMISFQDMAQCLSHELAHMKANKMGWNDPSNYFKLIWIKIRKQFVTLDTPEKEITAEDIRLMEGARGALNVTRTDKYNYVQGSNIQGLRDLYAIFKPGTEFVNTFKGSPWTLITKYDYKTSPTDYQYFEFNFEVMYTVIPFYVRKFKINRFGIYEVQSNNTLSVIRTF